MKKEAYRNNDPGISEIVGTTLILALLVVLAGVVGSVFLGYLPGLQKPTLATFSTSGVIDTTSHQATAISLVPIVGDPISESKGSSDSGGGDQIKNMVVTLVSPTGTTVPVTLCDSMPSTKTFVAGNAIYIFKRQNANYYLADSTSAKKCGGGAGDGGGGGGQTNVPFSPHGNWQIILADAANSNTVVYQTTVLL